MRTSSSDDVIHPLSDDVIQSSPDEIVKRLKTHYDYTLRRDNPFKVLVSTILSQRTKGINTKKASKRLFAYADTPEALAEADIHTVEQLVRPAGFYRVKAHRIVKAAQKIVDEFGGEVPDTIEELLQLEGVGRKTANCVLVYGFGKPALPVDVHVHRIANRLQLVDTKTPEETERELKKVIPKKEWVAVNQIMVAFGRDVCRPRNPLCEACFLLDVCPTGKLLTG
ncbi:MAG: endonuclease III [Candidatus Methanofastidiosia archaeon]|jgi:endonuclease-3